MSDNRDNDNTRIEIDLLTKELEDLTLEFNTRASRISRRLQRLNSVNTKRNQENPFKVGDRVKITNNLRGTRGTIGGVTRVTKKQVVLREESGNKEYHIRSYNNVELLG